MQIIIIKKPMQPWKKLEGSSFKRQEIWTCFFFHIFILPCWVAECTVVTKICCLCPPFIEVILFETVKHSVIYFELITWAPYPVILRKIMLMRKFNDEAKDYFVWCILLRMLQRVEVNILLDDSQTRSFTDSKSRTYLLIKMLIEEWGKFLKKKFNPCQV